MDQTTDQQEVLIARNNESGQVGAVVGQNPDGTPQMADAKSTPLSELVKFNKGQNPLEAFLSNFMRQAKNPTLFSFFKFPADDKYDIIAPAMADLIQKADENAAILKPNKVEIEALAQTVEQKQEEAPKQEQQKPTGIKLAPINPDLIDWDKIEKQWGIKRDDLEKSGALSQMVYAHITTSRRSYSQLRPSSATRSIHLKRNSRSVPTPTAHIHSCLTSSAPSRNSTKSSKGIHSLRRTKRNSTRPATSVSLSSLPTPRPGRR